MLQGIGQACRVSVDFAIQKKSSQGVPDHALCILDISLLCLYSFQFSISSSKLVNEGLVHSIKK